MVYVITHRTPWQLLFFRSLFHDVTVWVTKLVSFKAKFINGLFVSICCFYLSSIWWICNHSHFNFTFYLCRGTIRGLSMGMCHKHQMSSQMPLNCHLLMQRLIRIAGFLSRGISLGLLSMYSITWSKQTNGYFTVIQVHETSVIIF